MQQEPQDLSIEWLRKECVRLFATAAKAEEPDLPACSKLAELLYKMLPKGDGERAASQLELARQAREALEREGK